MDDKIKHYRSGRRGTVRGPCQHHHRTIYAAQLCGERDSRSCLAVGGGAYSDRGGVYAVHVSGDVTGPYYIQEDGYIVEPNAQESASYDD